MDNNLAEEFIGSMIEVVKSKNKDLQGAQGRIIDETKNTFIILDEKKQEKTLLKKGSVFRIGGKEISGEKILYRPEERIKLKR
ncbi:MAG TPA: ribonuclease P protein subunit [Candidatus Nanoarchaeia archaeon]|nr:ribonuclease P protein subunit [Candidatus Nanoarchaeia archaeon]